VETLFSLLSRIVVSAIGLNVLVAVLALARTVHPKVRRFTSGFLRAIAESAVFLSIGLVLTVTTQYVRDIDMIPKAIWLGLLAGFTVPATVVPICLFYLLARFLKKKNR